MSVAGTALQSTGDENRAVEVSLPQQVLPYQAAFHTLLAVAKSAEGNDFKAELPARLSHWLILRTEPEFCCARKKIGSAELLFRQELFGPRRVWIARENRYVSYSLAEIPFRSQETTTFKFIDLFAGIGGFRIALQNEGGRCVFSSEWDRAAKETYFNNFGEYPFGDIHQFTNPEISDAELQRLVPDHDILAAGFPCQPFSRAGVSARNSLGQKHGFDCTEQGNLFFDLLRIAAVKRPAILFLENVKNLQSHDQKRTFTTIRSKIEEELKYSFFPEVIDASPLVPQRRKRCYMVCFRDQRDEFTFPKITGEPLALGPFLEEPESDWFTLSNAMWEGHQRRTARNLARGAGFTAFTADLTKPANTLVSRYWKDGKECLIPQQGKNPRLLTPRECARLQGFPKEFRLPESPNAAYRQFGNSVAVPVVQEIAAVLVKLLAENS